MLRERERLEKCKFKKKINVKNNYKKIEKKKFKMKRLTQNLKAQLKWIWVGLDSKTK